MKPIHEKGFTLVELLVVISIIGVLATIILPSLNDSRSRARDAQRESDIKTIQNALEIYYVDNGKYPTTSWRHSNAASWESLETLVGNLPEDPTNETGGTAAQGYYTYSYFAHSSSSYCSGQAYMLVFNKENSNGTESTDGVTLCNGTSYGYGNAFVVGISPI